MQRWPQGPSVWCFPISTVLNSESRGSLSPVSPRVPIPHLLGSKATNIFQKLLQARHSYRMLAALGQKQRTRRGEERRRKRKVGGREWRGKQVTENAEGWCAVWRNDKSPLSVPPATLQAPRPWLTSAQACLRASHLPLITFLFIVAALGLPYKLPI